VKDPVRIVQKAGWVPEPVWTGAENLAPTGIRSPDRPARSESLYRLRYPALIYSHKILYYVNLKNYETPVYTVFSIHSILYSPLHLFLKHIQLSAYGETSLNHLNDFRIILIYHF
jgi:hypothetical protein